MGSEEAPGPAPGLDDRGEEWPTLCVLCLRKYHYGGAGRGLEVSSKADPVPKREGSWSPTPEPGAGPGQTAD